MTRSTLELFAGEGRAKRLVHVPLAEVRHSRFNTRRTRGEEAVDRLAERMRRNGFELTRALWAYPVGEGFEVFAGGTRLEAARRAGLDQVPLVVHEGFSDDAIARLADEDNENDEYHTRVSPLDVWAEYHRLWKEEGWTQPRIAEAKGVKVPQVSLRCKLHGSLPDLARKATSDGVFDEGHCEAVMAVTSDVGSLSPWLTTATAQAELVAEVLGKHRGKTAGVKPTVRVVRQTAKRWKGMIASAVEALESLVEPKWQEAFVAELVAMKARTRAAVGQALARAQRAKAHAASEARHAAEVADEAERRKAHQAARVAALTECVRHGDARQLTAEAPEGFTLLLTDPPYGMSYQSGRRTTSAKKPPIANDNGDALALLRDVLTEAYARMADDATAFVFTGWRDEPAFREVVEAAGFEIKGSLVWVKGNHGTGDLIGSFAPKHERILHAVKGAPKLRARPADVLFGKDAQDSDHPTEKPRDLLRQLIEATTDEGDVVVDPFAGSGSTLLEAHAMGREVWGCEIDAHWHGKIADALHDAALAEVA